MKKSFGCFLLILFIASGVNASQSSIIEADGYACMGTDRSKRQTEDEALAQAKKKAAEHTSTYIKSESRVKDFELEKDLIEAYSNATVKVIEELNRTWYRDVASGDCCQIRIKAEVIPDNETMDRISKGKGRTEDPPPLSMSSSGRTKIRGNIRKKRRSRFIFEETNPIMPEFCIKARAGSFCNSFPTRIDRITISMAEPSMKFLPIQIALNWRSIRLSARK